MNALKHGRRSRQIRSARRAMSTDLCALLRLLIILAHLDKTAASQHYPKPAPPDTESR